MTDQKDRSSKPTKSADRQGGPLHLDASSLKTLFDPLPIGIMVINHHDRALLFSNQFHAAIRKQDQQKILNEIFTFIDARISKRLPLNVNQELELNHKDASLRLGYTVYAVNRDTAMVFFSEIASKSIYLESKLDNEFYDRMSELVAEMAHEIGNPLSGINTILEVIVENMATWPAQKVTDYLERTVKEIRRLASFLNRIRDISNENQLDVRPYRLKTLVEKVHLQNEETLRQKRLKFSDQTPENLHIRVDEDAFHQILLNLLNNSLQILKPGREISVYVESTDEYYTKMVYANNGKPIPADDLEKIFSPFYTTRARGSGIGLAISRRLITRMGGTMRAENREDNRGVRFVLYIPHQENP